MPTNNHNFSMPARGADNWDQDWYDNFDALDARVALRGPAAERTNYTAQTDALYFATDTEEVYRGTGTTWEQFESFGENPTFGAVSATAVNTDELHSTTDPVVSVKSFGAEGDGAVDDTQAIVDAISHLPADGGTVYFPQGTYRTTAPITISKRNVKLVGNGRRNVQYPEYVSSDLGGNVPATIAVDHAGEGVLVDCNAAVNGFSVSGLTFYGEPTTTTSTAAIAFQIQDSFTRDFLIDDVTIADFGTGIIVGRTDTSTEPAIGALRVLNCNIMHNTRALNCTDAPECWVNNFEMRGCDAGQNGYSSGGGVRVRGSSITIEDNILEGQRDAVVCTGAFNNVSVKNNYFETNPGEACIQIQDYRGSFDLGPNYYGDVSQEAEHKITIFNNAVGGNITDVYYPKLAHNTEWPTLNDSRSSTRLNTDTDLPLCHTKRIAPGDEGTLGDVLINDRHAVTPSDPAHDTPIGRVSVQEVDTATTSRVSISDAWGPAVGDWVGVTALLRTNVSATPAVQILMDGSADTSLGSFSQNLSGYTRGHDVDDWVLVTAATRVAATGVSRPYMYIYPHGISPSTTGVAYVTKPYMWQVSNVNDIRPHFPSELMRRFPSAPTGSGWTVGDRVYNSDPAATEPIGWVVTGTNPVATEPFGTIG